MDRQVDLYKAVEVFGGYSELARLLKLKLSTVHAWHRRASLPAWRAEQIHKLAKRRRKDVWKQ